MRATKGTAFNRIQLELLCKLLCGLERAPRVSEIANDGLPVSGGLRQCDQGACHLELRAEEIERDLARLSFDS